jgi:anti-sigma B factor antagonist
MTDALVPRTRASSVDRLVTTAVRWTGRTVLVQVTGEVDIVTAPHVDDVMSEVLREAPRMVVVDLSGVAFLGVAGLSVLVDADQRTEAGTLRIVATGRPVLRILHLTGLASRLDVYPSHAAALSGS